MKIGILSDSHKKTELAKLVIKTLKKEGAELLIHAGDIVEEETLKLLEKSGIPYVAIMGNNDTHLMSVRKKYNLYQEPHYFKVKDLKVKLMHMPFYLRPDADLVVYGHTHYFQAEYKKNTLFVNPGEVCGRKNNICECVLLDGKKDKWILKHFTCKPNNKEWNIEKEVFE